MTSQQPSSNRFSPTVAFTPAFRPILQACVLALVMGPALADGTTAPSNKASGKGQASAAARPGATVVNPSAPFYAPSALATVVAGPVTVPPGAPNDVLGARNALPLVLRVGKSTVVRLPEAADRISVGNPNVADITLLKSNELYLLGKSYGTTNVILWRASGRTSVIELTVNIDTAPLEAHIRGLFPEEKDIQVSSAANSIVLSGSVSSTPVVDQVMRLADAYAASVGGSGVAAGTPTEESGKTGNAAGNSGSSGGGGGNSSAKVVNLLRVLNPQQVMLEVKVAEINRSFLESLGVDLLSASGGSVTYGIISKFAGTLISEATNITKEFPQALDGSTTTISTDSVRNVQGPGINGAGQITAARNGRSLGIRAQNSEFLVRLLAEPNIMTLSGQEGSFLAGGTLLIPSTETVAGKSEKSFKERDYGVSLKFTPTVLENGRIHLKVAPEVSEVVDRSLSDGGNTLPQLSIRRANSVVQLMDGQSLAIAGLIKGNATMQANRFPGLGELPILGTLFRSSDFVNERTELVFVVTPRLVKPLPTSFTLPGDKFVQPTRAEFFLEGRFEGKQATPANEQPAEAPANSNRIPAGFSAPQATKP